MIAPVAAAFVRTGTGVCIFGQQVGLGRGLVCNQFFSPKWYETHYSIPGSSVPGILF